MRASVLGTCGLAAALLALGCRPPKGSPDDRGGYPDLETVPTISPAISAAARVGHRIKTVFVIVMENRDWRSIAASPSAPYLNGTLLKQGAFAANYFGPRNLHPSEPNYIWLEAGDNLAILDDDDPDANHRTTRVHLTRQLDDANIPWKSYQEGIGGDVCPLDSNGRYGAKHNPMVFFDDVTDRRDPSSPHCLAHVRPYEELARDLAADTVSGYVFITPDLCDDMHDGCASGDPIGNGDAWLAREVPKILDSKAYREGGALFITWDENEGAADQPIGLIALSPFAKPGYVTSVRYTHSSLLRTIQDVFALQPYIRDAVHAEGLDDLFAQYP